MFRLLLVMAWMMAANVAAVPAVSATLVDTGTPVGGDYVLGLDTGPFGSRLAARFTLADNAIITGAEANMFVYGDGVLNYDIVSAANGLPDSGPALFSSAVALAFQPDSWLGASSLNWSLAAGDYWLVLRPEEGSGFWAQLRYFTPDPLSGYARYSNEESNWFGYAPHPVFGGDFGVRIFGTSGAVPEPASWGLMIAGFALTGVALRRRRVLAA